MKKVELLAPAGNIESLYAAVNSGCDAVYLGGKMFGARAFAGNFNDDELIEAIKYCHLYGVKVYVTCNILIYEHEVENFLRYISFLHKNNVDAIIIQDIGMLDLVHKKFPNLELHASTQMHIHNLDGAIMAKKLGCKRVVLARETPIEVVKEIRKKVDIDIEIFVHGSLCVSYSGQCLFSSFIGGRSGNRGSCVGSCRLPYKIVDKDNKKLNSGDYPLSMKDLCTLEYLDELIESGVTSFKIEGRMKSKEYVYMVTSLYRMAIDSYYKCGKVIIDYKKLDELKRIFNREFTRGYLFHEDMKNIINDKRGNHQGIIIGKVIDYRKPFVSIKLFSDVSIHDGIRIIANDDYGMELNEFYKNKKLVKEAHNNDVISFKVNKEIQVGSDVLLTKDDSLLEKIDNEITFNKRKVLIKASLVAKINKKVTLIINDGINNVECQGEMVVKADKTPITKEVIIEKLSKLGNTVYELSDIEIEMDDNIFISMKDLNDLRRSAINLLDNKRLYEIPYKECEYQRDVDDFSHVEKRSVLLDKWDDLPYDSIYSDNKGIIHLPKIMNSYDNLDNNLEYLIGELGAFNKLKNIYCDASMNVVNSYSVALLHGMGAKRITLSYELNYHQIENLVKAYRNRYHANPNLEMVISGKREVMTLKTNLCNIYNRDILYLMDRFKNKYEIKEKNGICYIYDFRNYKDLHNYYDIGINYLRDNKI